MKKYLMMFTMALMAVLTTGCSDEETLIFYYLHVDKTGISSTHGGADATIHETLEQKLQSFRDTYCTQWTATVTPDQVSKEDQNAVSRYETAEQAFKVIETEMKEMINNNTSTDVMSFDYTIEFYLTRDDVNNRPNPDATNEQKIKSYSFKLTL